ncbi:MAG: hypothetical protein WC249_02960 [Patescibacteria group bacterium]|jgi:hypothetical protein
MKEKKYYLTNDDLALSEQEFVNKYKVSRATYYRAKKSGYLMPEYHKREVEIDNSFVKNNLALILECAKMASYIIARRYWGPLYRREIQERFGITTVDFRDEAFLRIVERSAHIAQKTEGASKDSRHCYVLKAAKYAVQDFISSKLFRYSDRNSRFNEENEEDDSRDSKLFAYDPTNEIYLNIDGSGTGTEKIIRLLNENERKIFLAICAGWDRGGIASLEDNTTSAKTLDRIKKIIKKIRLLYGISEGEINWYPPKTDKNHSEELRQLRKKVAQYLNGIVTK